MEKLSYKHWIRELKNSRARTAPSDLAQKQCPKFFSFYPEYDDLECMIELIQVHHLLIDLARAGECYEQREFESHIICRSYYFEIQNRRVNFEIAKQLFYLEEPENKPTVYMEKIRSVLDILLTKTEKIEQMESKLKTLEQFQAQILDKLTVFAEMIDGLQTKQAT